MFMYPKNFTKHLRQRTDDVTCNSWSDADKCNTIHQSGEHENLEESDALGEAQRTLRSKSWSKPVEGAPRLFGALCEKLTVRMRHRIALLPDILAGLVREEACPTGLDAWRQHEANIVRCATSENVA